MQGSKAILSPIAFERFKYSENAPKQTTECIIEQILNVLQRYDLNPQRLVINMMTILVYENESATIPILVNKLATDGNILMF